VRNDWRNTRSAQFTLDGNSSKGVATSSRGCDVTEAARGDIASRWSRACRDDLVENRSHLRYLRHHLGDHARVLDLAIANTSAKDISVAMGLSNSSAEKRGPALIDAAIDALLAIDETARTSLEIKLAA
jgi:hypothetical protein